MKRQLSCGARVVWLGTIVGAFLIAASVGSAAEYVWTQKADMPTPRWTQTSAVVNGKVYVIGGYPSEGAPGEASLSTVEEYDPGTNMWTKKADMPTARCDFNVSSAVVDGRIYVIGGNTYPGPVSSAVEEYDPVTDTWTQKADMPTARWGLATCAFDGKVYAIGGYPTTGATGLTTVEVYDPVTDTWTGKADIPLGVALLNARVVRGKIYAIGGRPGLKAKPYVQEYNPATDTWTRKADMIVETSQMGCVVMDDKIAVIGGWEWSMNYPYTTIQVYNPETDEWTRKDNAPFLRASFSAEVVNNRIYAIGGTDRPHPCPATSTVYAYDILTDFNGDGKVDGVEVSGMVGCWGTDDPLYDIGPRPWGDGIIDVEDLKVLAEYIGKPVVDLSLIAHWAFDETAGDVAEDSAGTHIGTVTGTCHWHPDGGQIDGALELDGVTLVSSNHFLNPGDGPFSVLVWVQGGEPGQVIISQDSGSNWLAIDAESGHLMTAVAPPKSRKPIGPLVSDADIADSLWHRIALVWDGASRSLYVDGTLVVADAHGSLAPWIGGLNIGCDKDMTPGTFWTGLIDDVRIYNRAVRP